MNFHGGLLAVRQHTPSVARESLDSVSLALTCAHTHGIRGHLCILDLCASRMLIVLHLKHLIMVLYVI